MSKHDPAKYVSIDHYTTVLKALHLACDFIKENKFTVTKQNDKVLPYLEHGSLSGHFLIEARSELEKEGKDT
jgi:hypothetical protein